MPYFLFGKMGVACVTQGMGPFYLSCQVCVSSYCSPFLFSRCFQGLQLSLASFLPSVRCAFSLFFFVSPVSGLSILLIFFFKEPSFFFFHVSLLPYSFQLQWSLLLFLYFSFSIVFGFILFFFLVSSWDGTIITALRIFFFSSECIWSYTFLSTVWVMTKCWYIFFLFSFTLMYFFTSCETTTWSMDLIFRSVSFNSQVFVDFPAIFF